MATQLALSLTLRDGESFSNYLPGSNLEAVHILRTLLEGSERFVYLRGAAGTGKTHLLQATCGHAAAQGVSPAYIPLTQRRAFSTAMLEGLEDLGVVCIDDVHAIAGDLAWETALFHLYNRVRAGNARLVMASNAPPAELAFSLPDLSSRLIWGLVLQLHALNDDQKLAALRLRAEGRGLELPEDVARFLLQRCPRDLPALFELLERLDQASLALQRKLTIPFVSEMISKLR